MHAHSIYIVTATMQATGQQHLHGQHVVFFRQHCLPACCQAACVEACATFIGWGTYALTAWQHCNKIHTLADNN
jgi:hypothetical protein